MPCKRARGSFHEHSRNTTVVRDNDNQRVKWGLISFGRGRVERDANVAAGVRGETEGGGGEGGGGGGVGGGGKCVYTPAKKHAGLYTT